MSNLSAFIDLYFSRNKQAETCGLRGFMAGEMGSVKVHCALEGMGKPSCFLRLVAASGPSPHQLEVTYPEACTQRDARIPRWWWLPGQTLPSACSTQALPVAALGGAARGASILASVAFAVH